MREELQMELPIVPPIILTSSCMRLDQDIANVNKRVRGLTNQLAKLTARKDAQERQRVARERARLMKVRARLQQERAWALVMNELKLMPPGRVFPGGKNYWNGMAHFTSLSLANMSLDNRKRKRY